MKKRTSQRWLLLCCVPCALMLLGSVITTQAQKINKKRPGVYLTFKEFVKKTADEAYPSEGARFVLHNNTRWPIRYGEWLDPVLPGDVAMIYNIQMAETGCYEIRRHVDVVTRGNLLPGKTVSFTVPREDLPEKSVFYVSFDFSWELDRGQRFHGEAEHRAYFISGNLPHWPR